MRNITFDVDFNQGKKITKDELEVLKGNKKQYDLNEELRHKEILKNRVTGSFFESFNSRLRPKTFESVMYIVQFLFLLLLPFILIILFIFLAQFQ